MPRRSVRSFLVFWFVSALLQSGAAAQTSTLWQQRVYYAMDVTLHPDRHAMTGQQSLRYENNSPDTLRQVHYHLYFNAFHPGSMMAERNRRLPDPDSRIVPRIFDLGPEEVGFHRVESLSQDGRSVDFTIFDTVMSVELATPIPPGGSSTFEMDFVSQVPLQTRRSGRDNLEGIDYSMSQWYPKMANYDARGWHADPYVGREFYAPFGTFDVRITLPSEYVVGATGILQNPDDVGHGYSDAPVPDRDSLTWHFRAENVHDFAWAADPDYIHDVVRGDVTVHLLYLPEVAERWAPMRQWVPAIIEFFSERIGPYPYPQFTVAQAGDGGMEYPMVTFITGRRPPQSLLGVTVHEIAHMWFYGVVGSNETAYAWLDEGFAAFIDGEFMAYLADQEPASHAAAHVNVVRAQQLGLYERMNTPSDWFETNTGYGIGTYRGGQMVVDMLGYVISDSLRDEFLREYYRRFTFRHPNPYDVEKVAEDVSGLRLDWYFEQFGNTTRTVDYAVAGLRSRPAGGGVQASRTGWTSDREHSRTQGSAGGPTGESAQAVEGWETHVVLERKGPAVLPVDLRLTYEDGSTQWVNVPLGIMLGHKPVPEGWIVAEPWAWTSTRYTLALHLPARVVRAEIDPLLRTPDVNRLNDANRLPVTWRFLQPPAPSWSTYQVGWRPLGAYAHHFGFGAGLQARGTYMVDRYRVQASVKLWPEVLFSGGEDPSLPSAPTPEAELSAVDGIDFDVSLSHHLAALGPYSLGSFRSRKHLGILENEASLSILLSRMDLLTGRDRTLTIGVKHHRRTSDRSIHHEITRGFLPESLLSAYAALRYENALSRLVAGVEAGGLSGTEGISGNRAFLDVARAIPVGSFTSSLHVLVGAGAENLASQKRFRLGGASGEEAWSNAAYRNVGAALENPVADAHWVAFAGPGPVAYMRRTVPAWPPRVVIPAGLEDARNGLPGPPAPDVVLGAPSGRNVLALSARLISPRLATTGLLRPLRLDLFAGAGHVWNGTFLGGFSHRDVLLDAGLGIRYDVAALPGIARWTNQSDVLSGLQLHARLPFWASDPAAIGESNALAFRWLVGIRVDAMPWDDR